MLSTKARSTLDLEGWLKVFNANDIEFQLCKILESAYLKPTLAVSTKWEAEGGKHFPYSSKSAILNPRTLISSTGSKDMP